MSDTTVQNKTGILAARVVVERWWASKWHPVEVPNDDGIDGIIQLRRHGQDTGALIFAQVKCGEMYRQDTPLRPDHIGVKVGEEYLAKHRPRWNRLPGPVVLIYVDPTTDRDNPHSWWTDLRDPASYSTSNRQIVLMPRAHRFGEHSKGHFKRLCGTSLEDQALPVLAATREEVRYIRLGRSLKQEARSLYKTWAASDDRNRTHPKLGVVTVNRVGWRHICRRRRKPERIIQSWQLLGIAARMMREVSEVELLGHVKTYGGDEEGDGALVHDYVGLRARVVMPHRHVGLVQVVLRRARRYDPDGGEITSRLWFYSVYEQRRGRTGLPFEVGAKK